MAIVTTDDKHYKDIAETIREHLAEYQGKYGQKLRPDEMAEAIIAVNDSGYDRGWDDGYAQGADEGKAEGIAEGIEQGIEQGRQEQYDAFWEIYQNNGDRKYYANAFAGYGWTTELFRPKYDIKPTDAYMMFQETKISGDLVEILDELGVALDTSKATRVMYLFSTNTSLTRVGVIDLTSVTPATGANYLCYYAQNLKTIDLIRMPSSRVNLGYAFDNCTSLENVTFDGPITYNLSMQSCPLTHDSLMSIINALQDGLSYTLTIGSTNLAKLTEEEILIAENKGWTVK